VKKKADSLALCMRQPTAFSQIQFADTRMIDVSALRALEVGEREPDESALAYLHLIELFLDRARRGLPRWREPTAGAKCCSGIFWR